MMVSRRIRSASLLALVAMAGAGCADSAALTAPSAAPAVAALTINTTAAKPRPRVPYISSLQLGSIYVSISGGFTPYTVTVTNPARRTFRRST